MRARLADFEAPGAPKPIRLSLTFRKPIFAPYRVSSFACTANKYRRLGTFYCGEKKGRAFVLSSLVVSTCPWNLEPGENGAATARDVAFNEAL